MILGNSFDARSPNQVTTHRLRKASLEDNFFITSHGVTSFY